MRGGEPNTIEEIWVCLSLHVLCDGSTVEALGNHTYGEAKNLPKKASKSIKMVVDVDQMTRVWVRWAWMLMLALRGVPESPFGIQGSFKLIQ